MEQVRAVLGRDRRVTLVALAAALPAACHPPSVDHEACSDHDPVACPAHWRCDEASQRCVPEAPEDAMLAPDSPPREAGSGCEDRWLDGTVRLTTALVQGLPHAGPQDDLGNPWISRDERRLYFDWPASEFGRTALSWASRDSSTGPFGAVRGISFTYDLPAGVYARRAALTDDERMLVFEILPKGVQRILLMIATREASDPPGQFSVPSTTYLEHVDDTTTDLVDPFVTGDGLALYLAHGVAGHPQIAVATRSDTTTSFSVPTPVLGLDIAGSSAHPALSSSGRILVYTSGSPARLYYATRSGPGQPFGDVHRIPDVGGGGAMDGDTGPVLSFDACTLYFSSAGLGSFTHQIYAARVTSPP